MMIRERIDYLSIPEPNSGCWIWLGATRPTPSGALYGMLTVGSVRDGTNRKVAAYRASYEAYRGAIPRGLCVCHSCDNSLCVNPDHLFVGTQKVNIDDCVRKGRKAPQDGENNSSAKITAADAAAIKRRLLQGQSRSAIASEMSVSVHIVKHISLRRSWRKTLPEVSHE